MMTKLFHINPENPDMALIEEAAHILREGGTVAFPTETVYGLGANGLDAAATAKIFWAKGRPSDNPLILHIATMDQLRPLVSGIPEQADRLIRLFWPGPLTLVLPRSGQVSDAVTGGLETVAVRMPDHIIAQLLIAKAGVPVAAPSANVSGRPSPTTAQAVWEDLHGKIDAIIDGGSSGIGLESTVLDLTSPMPTLLRPGGVTLEELRQVLGCVVLDPALGNDSYRPKSPGMKYTHYAPRAQVVVVEGTREAQQITLQRLVNQEKSEGKYVGLLATKETAHVVSADVTHIMGRQDDLLSVAAGLFQALRAFDNTTVDIIIAEGVSEEGIGLAVMNRLRKAAGYHIVQAE
jgi:L-threonylcarbamoyladenylate synthase